MRGAIDLEEAFQERALQKYKEGVAGELKAKMAAIHIQGQAMKMFDKTVEPYQPPPKPLTLRQRVWYRFLRWLGFNW